MTAVYRNPIAIAAAKRHRIEAARAARKAGLPTKAAPIAPPAPVEDPKQRQREDQALADDIAQSTADAVSDYFNTTVVPKAVQAARKAVYASVAEAQKAATVEPEPMEVTIPHRDATGRIAYITKHKVTDPAELEDLVDD